MLSNLTRRSFNLSNQIRVLANKSEIQQRISLFSTPSESVNNSASTDPSKQSSNETSTSTNDVEIQNLKDKLVKCESELLDYKDKLLRALADAENTRNRMKKQVDDAKVFGIQGFSKDLLEVADVLNLAIANTDPKKNDQNEGQFDLKEQLNSMYKGLQMTETCLLKIFEKHGLVRINPKDGDKFDPNLHEAIFQIPAADKTPGTVNVVTKIGFRLNERVLRAAQVGVVQ